LSGEMSRSLKLLLVVQLFQGFRGGIISPILALFIRRQGVSVTQLGLLGTAGMMGWLIFEPLSGVIADRVKKKYMLAFGVVASTAIYALYPMAGEIWHFALLAFAMSSVMSFYAISIKSLTAELLPTSGRGRAYGRFLAAISIGGIAGPFVGGYLADALGYSLPFYLAAAVGLVSLVGIFLLKHDGVSQEAPEEMSEGGGIASKPVLTIFLVRGLYLFDLVFRQNFLPVYLNESPAIGASETEIGAYMSILRVMSALSQSFLGDVIDRIGCRVVIVSSLGLGGLGYLGLLALNGVLPLYLLGVFQGVFMAAANMGMMIHLMDVMPAGRTGMVMGLYSEAENVGGMIAAPSLGYVYDSLGSSYSVLYVVGMLMLNAVISAILIKKKKAAESLTRSVE
jgi:DHA1 family multidrug resistance protein-like MFS transporter